MCDAKRKDTGKMNGQKAMREMAKALRERAIDQGLWHQRGTGYWSNLAGRG